MGDGEQGDRWRQEAEPSSQAERLFVIEPDCPDEDVLSWSKFEYDPRPQSNVTTFSVGPHDNFTPFHLPQEVAGVPLRRSPSFEAFDIAVTLPSTAARSIEEYSVYKPLAQLWYGFLDLVPPKGHTTSSFCRSLPPGKVFASA